MVRELSLQGSIEYVEPQAAFSFLFGDERFVKRYHRELNEDPFAEVSSWTAKGSRTVKFVAPLNAPKVIKKVIGVDILRVTELQTFSRDGNTFTVKSDPTVEQPAGFNTRVQMVLGRAESGNGCVVSITATLECNVPVWGVQGTLESFMEWKAKKSFMGWLKLAGLYCKEQLALATGLPYTREEGELEDLDPSDDEFFDFSEDDEKAFSLSSSGSSRTLAEIYSRDGEVGLQSWLMQSVTRQLNGLHITCDASRSHIEELNRKLQKIEEDISIVQQQLQAGLYIPQRAVWGVLGVSVAAGVLLGAGHLYLRGRRIS